MCDRFALRFVEVWEIRAFRSGEDMRRMNNSVETVNAAATAIITAETRVQPTSVQKRRWGSCWGGYWCFGSHRNGKRIGHAVLVPEPMASITSVQDTNNVIHPPPIVLPFIAPPSSPASFLPSEPSSVSQSPVGLLSFTSLSANAYSPGPNSIFAIGPYAHETQLVSPPVFSTFTTEPSTAPFTPPPELVHMTTPSSPEVPFAKLLTSLDPNRRGSETGEKFPLSAYEFQSYQLYPGSPVGHLISPSSVISGSGTSSPFPDREFSSGAFPLLEFRTGEPPKLWKIDVLASRKWGLQRLGSGSLTPDGAGLTSRDSFLPDNQISEVASLANSDIGSLNDETVIDHRVSFELTSEEAKNLVDKEPMTIVEAVFESQPDTTEIAGASEREGTSGDAGKSVEGCVEQSSSGMPETIARHVDRRSRIINKSLPSQPSALSKNLILTMLTE
ncbi:hypothetical protein Scep_006224 [Stephania cephalantha]|uniref:Uncharacterized protein n=1 Tax=Stephania cephalantha TaxID=152367 RepID=A0AAP0KA37_9MAGN